MFNPSREEVRRFFAGAWDKHLSRAPLLGLEAIAVDVMLAHPEYRDVLQAAQSAAERNEFDEAPAHNPFLHLSLHLAIEEQLSIDQPRGLAREFERLAAARGDRHAALHEILDCLGESLWRAQRDGAPPDSDAYLECVKRRR